MFCDLAISKRFADLFKALLRVASALGSICQQGFDPIRPCVPCGIQLCVALFPISNRADMCWWLCLKLKTFFCIIQHFYLWDSRRWTCDKARLPLWSRSQPVSITFEPREFWKRHGAGMFDGPRLFQPNRSREASHFFGDMHQVGS